MKDFTMAITADAARDGMFLCRGMNILYPVSIGDAMLIYDEGDRDV